MKRISTGRSASTPKSSNNSSNSVKKLLKSESHSFSSNFSASAFHQNSFGNRRGEYKILTTIQELYRLNVLGKYRPFLLQDIIFAFLESPNDKLSDKLSVFGRVITMIEVDLFEPYSRQRKRELGMQNKASRENSKERGSSASENLSSGNSSKKGSNENLQSLVVVGGNSASSHMTNSNLVVNTNSEDIPNKKSDEIILEEPVMTKKKGKARSRQGKELTSKDLKAGYTFFEDSEHIQLIIAFLETSYSILLQESLKDGSELVRQHEEKLKMFEESKSHHSNSEEQKSAYQREGKIHKQQGEDIYAQLHMHEDALLTIKQRLRKLKTAVLPRRSLFEQLGARFFPSKMRRRCDPAAADMIDDFLYAHEVDRQKEEKEAEDRRKGVLNNMKNSNNSLNNNGTNNINNPTPLGSKESTPPKNGSKSGSKEIAAASTIAEDGAVSHSGTSDSENFNKEQKVSIVNSTSNTNIHISEEVIPEGEVGWEVRNSSSKEMSQDQQNASSSTINENNTSTTRNSNRNKSHQKSPKNSSENYSGSINLVSSLKENSEQLLIMQAQDPILDLSGKSVLNTRLGKRLLHNSVLLIGLLVLATILCIIQFLLTGTAIAFGLVTDVNFKGDDARLVTVFDSCDSLTSPPVVVFYVFTWILILTFLWIIFHRVHFPILKRTIVTFDMFLAFFTTLRYSIVWANISTFHNCSNEVGFYVHLIFPIFVNWCGFTAFVIIDALRLKYVQIRRFLFLHVSWRLVMTIYYGVNVFTGRYTDPDSYNASEGHDTFKSRGGMNHLVSIGPHMDTVAGHVFTCNLISLILLIKSVYNIRLRGFAFITTSYEVVVDYCEVRDDARLSKAIEKSRLFGNVKNISKAEERRMLNSDNEGDDSTDSYYRRRNVRKGTNNNSKEVSTITHNSANDGFPDNYTNNNNNINKNSGLSDSTNYDVVNLNMIQMSSISTESPIVRPNLVDALSPHNYLDLKASPGLVTKQQ